MSAGHGATHGFSDAPGQALVVVLDEDGIVEAEAVVGAAAAAHGVFLQHAQRGRGLARVEHRDAPASGVDESRGQRGDTRQPLQDIEGGTFGREERAGASGHDRHHVARLAARAVAPPHLDHGGGVALPEDLRTHVETGDDQRRLRLQLAARHQCLVYDRRARGVTAPEVFGQGARDQIAVRLHGQPGQRGHEALAPVGGASSANSTSSASTTSGTHTNAATPAAAARSRSPSFRRSITSTE